MSDKDAERVRRNLEEHERRRRERRGRPFRVQLPEHSFQGLPYAEMPGYTVRVAATIRPDRWVVVLRNLDTSRSFVVRSFPGLPRAVRFGVALAGALRTWNLPVEVELPLDGAGAEG